MKVGLAQVRVAGTDSRIEILRAAEQIFAKKGYTATSTREIAETAGVTKGLLFYHFQTKQHLYLTVIENLIETLGRLAVPPRMEGLDRMVHVRSFLDGWADFQAEHPNALKLVVREIMDEGKFSDKIIDEYMKPLYQFGIEFVRAGIEEGVFRPLDEYHFIQILAGANAMYYMILPFHERIVEKDLDTPEAHMHRKEEVWQNFSRMLRRT